MSAHRPMFWQIEATSIFYLLTAVALVLFLIGAGSHIWVWRKSSKTMSLSGVGQSLNKMILDVFTGRRLLKGDIAAGLMHFAIFWGFFLLFAGTCVLSIHHYIVEFLEGEAYLWFSLIMEIGGVLLLVGIVWAMLRRYWQRVPRLERRLEDAILPVWFVLMVLSGFLLEGARLSAEPPQWAAWSFVGNWAAGFIPAATSQALYPTFWWVHALLCLGFIAVVCYSKMFHIIGAPASIFFSSASTVAPPSLDDEAGKLDVAEAVFYDGCMRCGRCVEACPSSGAGEAYAPRDFVQWARKQMWQTQFPYPDVRLLSDGNTDGINESLWYCTTCRACLEVCPVYGAAFEAVAKERRQAVEEGTLVPALLNQTLEKLFRYDNPWESSKKQRGAWAEDLDITNLTKRGAEADLCYFVGCTTSFDDRAMAIAQSFSKILQQTSVKFGILGKKEPCCGDIARRVGEFGLFEEQKEKCETLFDKYGITEVATSSPHCYHTLANDYPDGPFRARHYTMVLKELLDNKKLSFVKPLKVIVTFHDPCYLGRHNRIFDEPRDVIRAIPGVRLVEMEHCREDSLCCGGGGGRMWQDLKGERKMSEVRIEEAEATGAQILITACPLCLIMMEDARKAAGTKEGFRVMDLNELLLEALENK
ncbi:Eqo2: Etf:quinone oxidoreductase [Desulfosarcina variabilis str. Montpellier]|uniref:heterodisulfide reductase-related iron-sulfur binding cluster n=1 Tax=Desulfosarcina variabilis TaxID=2300 RepID=UPI003AFA7DCC